MSHKKNSSTKSAVIMLCIVAVLFAAIAVSSFLRRHIPENPPGTTGNTAGNLNNGGLFCEDEGVVYFANAYDSGTLYSMNADETDVKKLSSAQIKSINAAGGYLYFYQTNSAASSSFSFLSRFSGLYRSKKDGTHSVCLTRDPVITAALYEDTLYYQHFTDQVGTTLHKIQTDKTGETALTDYMINPACIANGTIYFNGTREDHALYTLDTSNDSVSRIWPEGNLWNPIVQDGWVYYMNISDNYSLCRYSLSDGGVEVLTEDRVDLYNLSGNYIYFQTSGTDAPALKRMTLDGQNAEIVREGTYQNIQITSNYVYFNEFNIPIPVYKTSAAGPVGVSSFTAAESAAAESAIK